MGQKRIAMEADVFSCSCGWVGVDPLTKRVERLNDGQLGRLALGPRNGRAYLAYICPLCRKPIAPSPSVELFRVASIHDLASGNDGSNRRPAVAQGPSLASSTETHVRPADPEPLPED